MTKKEARNIAANRAKYSISTVEDVIDLTIADTYIAQ